MRTLVVVPLVVLLAASSARADDAFSLPPPPIPSAPNADAPKSILLGAFVGGALPLSALQANLPVGLSAGYVLPMLDRRLAVRLDATFAHPTASGTVSGDPRVAGPYSWQLGLRELMLMPNVTFDLPKLGAVQPSIGLGARVYLLESVVEGSVGPARIPATIERSTQLGLGVPLGAAYPLGPGALTGTLLFEWAGLNQVATGAPTSTAALSLLVGYRLSL